MILKADRLAQRLTEGESSANPDPLVITPIPRNIQELAESGAGSIDLRLGTWFLTLRQARMPSLDIDKPGLTDVLRRAAAHPGAAFVEVFQNCNIYNDGEFDYIREDKDARTYLEHGNEFAGTGITHDETDFATAFALAQLTWEKDGAIPLGVFRDVQRESYDELVQAQLDNAKGDGDLQALVGSGDTWMIS